MQNLLDILKKIWVRTENFVFLLVFLLVGLYFLLQSSYVQNWLIQKATAYLSAELNTDVHIRHIDVAFFDNLLLEDLVVFDQKGDTLLYCRTLKAGLNSNIFQLLSNKLEFNEIGLHDAYLHIVKREFDCRDNMQFILDWLPKSKSNPNKPKSPFSVKVKKLDIANVKVVTEDWVGGLVQTIELPTAHIRINKLDIPSKIYDIETVEIDGLYFGYQDYAADTLTRFACDSIANKDKKAKPAVLDTTSVARKVDTTDFARFKVNTLSIKNSRFKMDKFFNSPARSTEPESMDFDHLLVGKINIELDSFSGNDDLAFKGRIKHFAAQEQQCGFEIVHGEANDVRLSDKMTALYGLKLETANSILGDTFEMHYDTYRDFKKFNNKVVMRGVFKPGSHVELKDIVSFSNPLAKNAFFTKNRNEIAELSGEMYGKVNALKAKDIKMKLGKGILVEGGFIGDDLAKGTSQIRLEFRFTRLQSDMATLRDIIPGFTAPSQFDKLGRFYYEGSYFLMFGYNHILDGHINTEMGRGKVNMKLDLANGKEKATYSGTLDMKQFDLANWTGNKQFGKTSFSFDIEEGSNGLTLSTIDAHLKGQLDTFNFRGYTYRNLEMKGHFFKKLFDGNLSVTDPNLSFVFDGTINLKDTIPVYNFKADIKKLDLGALNLLSKDWVVSGNIENLNLKGNKPEDIDGKMNLKNIKIVQNKTEIYRIDSVGFQSLRRLNGSHYFDIHSEIASGYLDGVYELDKLPQNLLRLFSRNYPEFAQQLGMFNPDTTNFTDNYFFNLSINNSKNFTKLLGIDDLDTLKNIQAIGRVDGDKSISDLKIEIPSIKYAGVRFDEVSLNWNGIKTIADYDIYVHKTVLAGNKELAPIHFFGATKTNKLMFNLQAQNFNSILKNINLNGSLSTVDSIWELKFNPSDISLFNESWYMDEDNFVRFGRSNGKNFFITQNFDLFSEDANKRVFLYDIEGKGVRLGFTNFDLNFLNNIVKVKNLTYRGKIYDFDFAVQDAFNMTGMSLYINTDTFFLKEKPLGFITGNVDQADLKSPISWNLSLVGKESRLNLKGGWLLGGDKPQNVTEGEIGPVNPKEVQVQAEATDFPMEVLQLFIPGISQTTGKFDASVRFGGPFNKLGMDGMAKIKEASLQMDYLKAKFNIKNQNILLTDYVVWADGDTIYDGSNKSMALVRGGLRHDHFSSWRIDCAVSSVDNNFMILNTTKDDNPSYYGQAAGKFSAKFSGTFSKTDIFVNAVTGKDSRLYIPLTTAEDAKEVSFIKFKVKDTNKTNKTEDTQKNFQISDLKGLSIEMNLSITEEAEVQMIFDEQAGDIVKGRGVGDINLIINREGEFKMYGGYTIRKGEYLFTLLNVVAKPFTVEPGGTISWYGDPLGAQINLKANYDKSTPLYNLLADELQLVGIGEDPRISEAKKSTTVNVQMQLDGDLFKPNIGFNLKIPSVAPEIKTLTDNKLRLLRQEPNEMNRQVFGLIVIGSFLQSNNNNLLQGSAATAGINTVSQMLSSQFSSYLTSLASDIFGNAVSSFDFDVAYNENQSIGTSTSPNFNQRELQIRMTSGFKDDRIIINSGAQFGVGASGTTVQNGLIGQDVTVEIRLTENKQWRLKIYERLEPDRSGGSRRQRFGVGLAFDKEYESFDDMMQSLRKTFTKAK